MRRSTLPETAAVRKVCQVVWEGGRREDPSYPIPQRRGRLLPRHALHLALQG